jgi:hypothetical protein
VLRVTAKAERQAKAETKRFPPPKGSRYFLIRLALTYTGSGVGQIGEVTGNALRVVSADGVSYSIFQNGSCGIFPPDDVEDVVTVVTAASIAACSSASVVSTRSEKK